MNIPKAHVYWGVASRDDLGNIFGKAFPDNAKVFFAWKKSGWEDNGKSYREHFLGFWASEYTIFAGIAKRTLKKNPKTGQTIMPEPWRFSLGTNKGANGFRPEKELKRAALGFEWLGMPIEVAQGYVDACTRMVRQEVEWAAGVTTDDEPEVDESAATGQHGLQVPPPSAN